LDWGPHAGCARSIATEQPRPGGNAAGEKPESGAGTALIVAACFFGLGIVLIFLAQLMYVRAAVERTAESGTKEVH
jgi:hypothetical protein